MKRLLFATYFAISSLSLLAQKADTSFYSVVKTGIICGAQKIWKSDTNEYNYIYHFNDRFRGDSITEMVKTNPEGLVTNVSVTGVDYYKNPYFEQFVVAGDSSISMVNEKRNSGKFSNELYYLTTAPGVYELKIKWLLKQPDLKSATTSGKIIQTRKPMEFSITINDTKEHLKLFAIYIDSSFIPDHVWLKNDLQFFAVVDKWISVVPKGYENWTDTLFSIQELVTQDIYEKQVNSLSTKLQQHIVIKNVNLFESATATTKENMTVEVVDGIIFDVYPSVENKSILADTIIDSRGKFLMPGLWDMHSHYNKNEGIFYLACGITHIRDMGNSPIVQVYQHQIRTNKLLGPDISYLSGFIDKVGPMQGSTGKIVNSLSEALIAIEEYHKKNYNQIKIYNLIEPGWIKPMAVKAHGYGMKVCGHIPGFTNEIKAINDGYDEITHMRGIFHGLIGGDTTYISARLPAERIGKMRLTDMTYLPTINLMKQKSVSLDATMALFENWYNEFAGDTCNALKPIETWLPEQFKKDNFIVSQPFGTNDKKEMYKASFENCLKMLKILYDNGIILVPGTDARPYYLHRELEIYVDAGIPANQVLKIATYNAAKDCELQNQFGEIAIGKPADFILIAGNPTKNISEIRRVELVVKNGRQYEPQKLYASQGWKYYY